MNEVSCRFSRRQVLLRALDLKAPRPGNLLMEKDRVPDFHTWSE
jgi:hypothetical protein